MSGYGFAWAPHDIFVFSDACQQHKSLTDPGPVPDSGPDSDPAPTPDPDSGPDLDLERSWTIRSLAKPFCSDVDRLSKEVQAEPK